MERRWQPACGRMALLMFCYRVKYEDNTNVIVRFAALGRVIFRQEKVGNEVTVLQYLRQHTQIPVPEVYGAGTCWAGPYIVMAFVEGDLLSNVFKDPLKKEGRPVVNPRISDRALKIAYRSSHVWPDGKLVMLDKLVAWLKEDILLRQVKALTGYKPCLSAANQQKKDQEEAEALVKA
ncbi:hypothetical protein B7463_g11393, partial [Scytalidium lignicola]